MRKLLTLPLVAALAFQFTTVASADSVTPGPSPAPSVTQLPNAPFDVPETAPQAQAAPLDPGMKWFQIGLGVLVLGLVLFDHQRSCGTSDNTIDDDFSTDGAPRRPAVGLTLHFPIP